MMFDIERKAYAPGLDSAQLLEISRRPRSAVRAAGAKGVGSYTVVRSAVLGLRSSLLLA